MARSSTGLGTPIAMFGILSAFLLILLSKKKIEPKSASTGAVLTPDQQSAIATALQALGVDAGGSVKTRATPTAVTRARSLAKTLAASGFPEAAATLNQYATLAEKAGG